MKVFKFVLISALWTPNAWAMDVKHSDTKTVVRPFGLQSRQPPAPSSVVRLGPATVSIKAKQVCGYTDWSTLQIDLPKQLLSKTYWNNVGNQLVTQAKQTVLDLSYALPGMLTCNISPTFCHVFNQAELMASFEGQLTMETCKIVDGMANVKGLQHEDLRQCIESWVNTGRSASEAREKCLTGGNLQGPRTPKTQADKIAATGDKDPSFDMNSFLDGLFPEKVTGLNRSINYNSGNFVYSRRTRTKRFFQELFPGIEVKGSAIVRNSGTFQPVIENELSHESKKVKDAVSTILERMRSFHKKGFNGPDVIKKSEDLWANKETWKQNGEPNPIYRSPYDDSEPTFIVRPEQIYELLPLAEYGLTDNQALTQVMERMGEAAAYLKVQDHLFTIQTRAIEECYSEKNQGAVAQTNCEAILKKTKLSMEFLEHRMLAEERAVQVQSEISSLIQGVKSSQSRNANSASGATGRASGRIPLPIGG